MLVAFFRQHSFSMNLNASIDNENLIFKSQYSSPNSLFFQIHLIISTIKTEQNIFWA